MNTVLLLIQTILVGAYSLQKHYSAEDLFQSVGWNYYDGINGTGRDPTDGTVIYVNHTIALNNQLVMLENGVLLLGAKRLKLGQKPQSVRLESTEIFNSGLFIFDIVQMPTSCGTWPAIWTYNDPWPFKGEIDVVEGINGFGSANQMVLHTSKGCEFDNAKPTNCNSGGDINGGDIGCSIASDSNTKSFGSGFNQVGGGVYVLEWSSQSIEIWHFQRPSVPQDILNNSITKVGWPPSQAFFKFGSKCSPKMFSDQKIVINLTFCGSYAGALFPSHCPKEFQYWGSNFESCSNFVTKGDIDFASDVFKIRSIKIYKL